MVESHADSQSGHLVWVVRPTLSLTWPEAKRWLCLISTIPLASGSLFLWFGIPLVLAFAGLEVGLLWAAFYSIQRKGQWCETIDLSPGILVVEKGRLEPSQREEFDPAWVQVHLAEPGGWHPGRLMLRSHGRSIELGSFLTESERQMLARALITALRKSR